MLKELEAELVRVQIDHLRNNVFIGSVYVRKGRRIHRLDARPSDGIALAVGNRAPIFVSREVLEQAAVSEDELGLDATAPP